MRELTKNQKKLIRNEVLRNKLLGYKNPFEIATNVFFRIQELNDFETYFDDAFQWFIDRFGGEDPRTEDLFDIIIMDAL